MQPFIGSRIRLYRSMAGKTQEQLSAELDVTKQHLGLIERGECNPSLELLKKICQVLDVSPAAFFLGCTFRDEACGNDDCGIIPVSTCGSWTVNLDDSTMMWSEALYRLLGESPQRKPSLKRFAGRVQDQCRHEFLQFFKAVLANRSSGDFCCTITRRDGETRVLQIKADIIPSGPATSGLALFSVLDITDLQNIQRTLLHSQNSMQHIVEDKTKSLLHATTELQQELERRIQAEELLREKSKALTESEANFRSFFDTVDDIFLVIDSEGLILHANPAAVAKTGYLLEELTDMHVLDLHEAEKRAAAQAILTDMLHGECEVCDLPIITKHGRVMPVESRIWIGKWNGRPCIYGICMEQLRISSTLLRLICDNVPDMIWAKDLQKRYIFANTAICRDLLSAVDTVEPIGKTDMFFALRERARHADNPEWHTFGELCQDSDQITMDAGTQQQFDEYGNIKGRFMFLDVRKAPLFDDSGIIIGTVGSAREVTEQRRMAQALETSQQVMLTILDSLPAEIYVSDLESWKILFMNKAMKKSFGRDCTGEICHQAFRHSTMPCAFCTAADLLDWEGRPVGMITWESFNPISGRWTINSDQAIVWIDGRMAKIQIAIDITDRRKAEDALRSERDLFSAGPVMTIVWEPAPGWPVTFVSANCLDVLGYTPEEMTAASFRYDTLIHPEDLPRIMEEVPAHIASWANHFEQSYRLRTKSGQYVWTYDFTKLVRNNQGEVTSIRGYMFDQSHMKAMEQALELERERLAGIIEGTNVGTWEWYIESGQTVFNDRWAEIVGYDLEELTPTTIETWRRLTHPDDLRQSTRLLEKHFDFESGHYEAEIRMRHKAGHWAWVLDRGKVLSWTPDGRPVVMRGTHQDITERKQAEEALRESEARFRTLLGQAPIPICYVENSGVVTYRNTRFIETIGYTQDEVPSLQEWWQLAYPDASYRRTVQARWSAAIEKAVRAKCDIEPEEYRIVCKDGSVRIMLIGGIMIDGAFLASFVDITERKQAEEALRESEARLRIITDSTQDAIVVMDQHGAISFWNPAAEKILGYRADDVLGRNLHQLLAPERYLQAHWVAFPEFLTTGHGNAIGKTIELAALHKNGHEISIELSLSSVSVQGQRQAVGMLRDITARRQAEDALIAAKEQAEIANRAKSEFLANMSHEIRTPLNGILGMMQLLEETALDEEQRQFCALAIQSTHRLTTLLSDILDLARVEARKLHIRAERFHLPETIGQSIDLFESVATQTGLSLTRHLDPGLPCWTNGDSLRLQQVLSNLLGNAFKFTKHGRIHVEAYPLPACKRDTVRIFFAVSDTGCGIGDDDLATLFRPFTQASQGYARNHQGAGLGLTISKHLVSLMGGSMAVESEKGVGTTFYFCVTLGRETSQSDDPGLEGRAAPQQSLRVLLAEDDVVSALAVQTMLENSGIKVTYVENGQTVLDALTREPFDLILMDIQMPDMDGLEATRRIRQGQAGGAMQAIPIIAMTAYAMSGDRERFLEAGMDGYISKPLDIHTLARLITTTLIRGKH